MFEDFSRMWRTATRRERRWFAAAVVVMFGYFTVVTVVQDIGAKRFLAQVGDVDAYWMAVKAGATVEGAMAFSRVADELDGCNRTVAADPFDCLDVQARKFLAEHPEFVSPKEDSLICGDSLPDWETDAPGL